MSGEDARVNERDSAHHALNMALVILLMLGCCAFMLGCRAGTPAIMHPAIGSWGVRTQSGEVVEVIELRSDGTYLISEPAGIRGLEGDGRLIVVDDSTLRAADSLGSAGSSVEFVLTGDELTLVHGGFSTSGFKRIGER